IAGGGVEVDEADAEQPLDHALMSLDVLQALIRRRVVGAREDAMADVDALVGDDVGRVEALEPAPDERDHDQHYRDEPGPPRMGVDARPAVEQLRSQADGAGHDHPLDVEGAHRTPGRAPAPDDLLAAEQFHRTTLPAAHDGVSPRRRAGRLAWRAAW